MYYYWLRGNFYDSTFGSIRNGRHLFIYLFIFVKSASELAAIRAGINLVPTAFVTLVQRNGKTKYPWDKQNSCYSG